MRVLHVAAEIFPWVKVGGLGDVIGALPQAQGALGMQVRLLMPAYRALKAVISDAVPVGNIAILLGTGSARLLLGHLPSGIPIYLLDAPHLFDRPGGPYDEWGDSHIRFAALSYGAAWLAKNGDGHGWKPQVLHCHDWQTALAPVYLADFSDNTPTVMSIHNLAYQGIYDAKLWDSLWLSRSFFKVDGLEFYGSINYLKGGLQFATKIATVSPTYAKEIQGPGMGEGLEGLIQNRHRDLVGILNGVDTSLWHPAKSPHIPVHYGSSKLNGKSTCKSVLQSEMGLEGHSDAPLFAAVGRMAPQKGLDILLTNVDHLVGLGGQLVVLGSGDESLENSFREATQRHPGRVAVKVGYDEGLAHRIMAGADVLVMPSRYEPCGLTQLYALAYGTLPLVRRTGGLADTVVDANQAHVVTGRATGFMFDRMDGWELGATITRACDYYSHQPKVWQQMQKTGMAQDFGWRHSAEAYRSLYLSTLTQ